MKSHNSRAGNETVSLSEFLERSFQPQRPGPVREYREAIDWLERFLKRPALLGDLAEDNIWELQRFVAKFGYGPARIRTIKTRLSSLAKHAWRMGLIAHWRSTQLRKHSELRRELKRNRFLQTAPAKGTLAAILRDQLSAQLAGRTRQYGNSYAAAIRQFDQMLGRYSTPGDLTPEALDAFRQYLQTRGRASSTVFGYQTCLRRVGRVADPERFRDRRVRGRLPDPEPGTVRAFFASEYRPANLVGCSRTHLRDFQQTWKFLHQCFTRDLRVDELNDSVAATFFSWLLDVRGVSPVSVNGHRLRLFAVWRFAVQRGLLQRDPRVRKLRVDLDVPDAWSEDEVRRIIDATSAVPWRRRIAGIPGAKFFRGLLLVVYWTGMRLRTLLAIRRGDVDLAGGWLTVPGSAMKNRRGQRYRLGTDAVAAIAEIWEPERELLFPWSETNRETFHRHLRRIIDAAGVAPSTRRAQTRLHKMRRTVATLTAMHRGLAAACELLGHSSAEVTRRYIDTSKLPGQDATQWLPVVTDHASLPAGQSIAIEERPPRAWLDEAGDLFRLGFHTAAAVTLRVAVERWVQSSLGRSNSRRREPGLRSYVRALREQSIIDQPTYATLRSVIRATAAAARGRSVDPQAIAELLSTARELLDSFPTSKEKHNDA